MKDIFVYQSLCVTKRVISIQIISLMLSHLVRPIRSFSSARTAISPSLPAELTAWLDEQTKQASLTKSGSTFSVYNPADPQQAIANVPVHDASDAQAAITRANEALASWRDGTTAAARGALLTAWSTRIKQQTDLLATLMTLESGKALSESKGEVAYAASFLDYYAAEAVRPSGFLVPTPFVDAEQKPRGQIMAVQQAVGTCAMISPWNFPAAMITRKVGPAFAVGCTAVVKPSELTPLTALYMQQLALEAGFPKGVLEMVTPDTTNTPAVGQTFCQSPNIRKLSFTGSTAVGKTLMRQSSETMQRLSLELGGNAVFMVFEDANLDQAVQAAVAAKFRNAGQTCVCADRFLVHERVHDEFVARLQARIDAFVVGPGLDPNTTMGPLITSQAVQSVSNKVDQAVAGGAVCVTGGTKLSDVGPNFYAPTILTHVEPSMSIWSTETFGPVAAIKSFDSEEEAVAIANDSRVGLASYFCTQDLARAFRVSQSLECGLVGVNEGVISTCYAPFGGVKESGMGREGSPLGTSEYVETKYIFMNT